MKLTMSDDVKRLNPDLADIIYQDRPERLVRQRADRTVAHDSSLERDFDLELTALGWPHLLHPFTFHLPGGVDYTPDFIAFPPHDGQPIVYEVKGNMKQKNARDSYTRFRIAAGLHRWATFAWVTRDASGQWSIKIVFPNEEYGESR